MSRIKLKDIVKYSKGSQINGDDLINDGKYIYLNGGINPSGRWDNYNVKGNTITISEGGNSSGFINYINEPFWCGAHCYYLYDGPDNTKYLYYALKSQQSRVFKLRTGACMPNIKKADLGMFEFEFDFNETTQMIVVNALDRLSNILNLKKQQLILLDNIINLLMYVNVILTEIRKSINPRQKGQIIDLVFKTSAAQPSVILIILFYRSHSRLRIPLNDRFLETC